MTVSTAILKVVATLSSSEKGRKTIGIALLTPIVILLLVVGVFVALAGEFVEVGAVPNPLSLGAIIL